VAELPVAAGESPAPQPFVWTEQREYAAAQLAKGPVTMTKVAADLDVKRHTIAEWRKHPDFAARVDSHVEAFRAAMLAEGVADKAYRMHVLQTRHEQIAQVFAERASDSSMEGVPGGTTGLLIRKLRGVGKGQEYKVVEEFEGDTGLLAAERDTLEQAKREMEAVEGAGGSGRITVIVDI
jgi:hypothetical protein